MSKINIFKCDVCQQEIRWKGWENAPTPVKIYVTGGDIQYKQEFEEVCNSCGKKLAAAFAETRKTLDPRFEIEKGEIATHD